MPKKPPQDKARSPDLRSGKAYVRRRPGPSATPRSFNEIMTGKGWLQNLTAARSAQQEWLAWLREQLPAELRAAAVNVIPKGHELVVMSRSAAWSTRLRYALAAVESRIRERAPQISTLRVRVAPPER